MVKLLAWLFWKFNSFIASRLNYQVTNEPTGPALFAFWHGQSFPVFFWAKHRKLCIHPTDSWRGDILAFLAEKYKYKVVRYPEKGTPLERSEKISQLLMLLAAGCDAAIAVDGPPPPLKHHQAKAGIIYLSKKSQLPIVPVGIKMKRKISLPWRWDKYEIPLPRSGVIINFGNPVIATDKTTTQELEGLLAQLAAE
ncbi:MAG: hypothetical protein KKA31_04125 [Candidatus Margulisbacteria bacterium]|nr:hypothetical protein [Candidatus Margulisiibacteriota bacterium]